MRRRLVTAMVAVTMAGILILGIPLTFVSIRYSREEAGRRLQEEAEAIEQRLEAIELASGSLDAEVLGSLIGADRQVEVLLADGRRIVAGPPVGDDAIHAVVHTAGLDRIELSEPASAWRSQARRAVVGIAGLAVLGLATAYLVGRWVARRLIDPLDQLADSARRLGAGDFSARSPPSGIAEIDAIGAALDASAQRVGSMVARERRFSSEASHQLRTPLTALSLRLEELRSIEDLDAVRTEADAALDQVERLQATIDALLAAARTGQIPGAVDMDLRALVRAQIGWWEPLFRTTGRRIVLHDESGGAPLEVRASPAALGQALDVVIDNAYHHGAGRVDVTLRRRDGRASVRVRDEGPGIDPLLVPTLFERGVTSDGDGAGLGLAIARDLLAPDGGRLELVGTRPATFELWV